MYKEYLAFAYNSITKVLESSYNYFLSSIYLSLFKRHNFICYYYKNKKFYIKPCGVTEDLDNPDIFLVTILEEDVELLDYNFTEEFLQVYGPFKNFHKTFITLDEFLSFTKFIRDETKSYKLKMYDTNLDEYISSLYLNDMVKIE